MVCVWLCGLVFNGGVAFGDCVCVIARLWVCCWLGLVGCVGVGLWVLRFGCGCLGWLVGCGLGFVWYLLYSILCVFVIITWCCGFGFLGWVCFDFGGECVCWCCLHTLWVVCWMWVLCFVVMWVLFVVIGMFGGVICIRHDFAFRYYIVWLIGGWVLFVCLFVVGGWFVCRVGWVVLLCGFDCFTVYFVGVLFKMMCLMFVGFVVYCLF